MTKIASEPPSVWAPLSEALALAIKACLSRGLAEAEIISLLRAHPDCWRARSVEPAQDAADFWHRPSRRVDWDDCSAISLEISDLSGIVSPVINARLYGIEVRRDCLEQHFASPAYVAGVQSVPVKNWRGPHSKADLEAAMQEIERTYPPDAQPPFEEIFVALRARLPDLPRDVARKALRDYAPRLRGRRGRPSTKSRS